jgi:hypothetical protein
MGPRDDFSAEVKRTLAGRVGLLCSNSECRALTGGPQSDPAKVVNLGVAAHITAAAPGGPRFDEKLSPDERSSATNGVWLCQNCAKRIDSDVSRYPTDLLQAWKRAAESRADSALGKSNTAASLAATEPSHMPTAKPTQTKPRWKQIAAVLSFAAAIATVATFLGLGRRPVAPSPTSVYSVTASVAGSSVPGTADARLTNSAVVAASPGATVLQAARDIVIANPPPIPSAHPPAQATRSRGRPAHGPIQTMINSPGGIQAAGNVTVSSDRRLINSMSLQIDIELVSAPATPTEVETDVGIQSIVGLSTKDKTRIRFATDFMIKDQQVSRTTRRLTFAYTPETPDQVLGKPVDFLSSFEILAVNYGSILKDLRVDTTKGRATLQCLVRVNGIAVSTFRRNASEGVLGAGPNDTNVESEFSQIPAKYAAVVARQPH